MRVGSMVLALVALAIASAPASAQKPGKGPRHYKVKSDQALVITREVLVKQGFAVERVQDKGDMITIWYYRGNMGRGKGRGPLQKMVIRRVREEIVFEAVPPAILVDIDVRLRF